MYLLAWNHFFYLTQAIEDIDSNAKEEMKAEEQVIYSDHVTLLPSTTGQQCTKAPQLDNSLHALRAYNIQKDFQYHWPMMRTKD